MPHLQPVTWRDEFPVMGDQGAPVLIHEAPVTKPCDYMIATSDTFQGKTLGLQWQWQAHENPSWYQRSGNLRLFAYPAASLFHAGQYLSQLMQAFNSCWEIPVTVHFTSDKQRAGVAMMGYSYRYLCLEQGRIALYDGAAAEGSRREKEVVRERLITSIPFAENTATLTMEIADGQVNFGYDGQTVGEPFVMTPGGWTCSRPGIFCADFGVGDHKTAWANFTEVRITDLDL